MSFTSCLKSDFGDAHPIARGVPQIPRSCLEPLQDAQEIGSCGACASDLSVSSGYCHRVSFQATARFFNHASQLRSFVFLSFTSFIPLPLMAGVLQVVSMGGCSSAVFIGAVRQSQSGLNEKQCRRGYAEDCTNTCTQVSDEGRNQESR